MSTCKMAVVTIEVGLVQLYLFVYIIKYVILHRYMYIWIDEWLIIAKFVDVGFPKNKKNVLKNPPKILSEMVKFRPKIQNPTASYKITKNPTKLQTLFQNPFHIILKSPQIFLLKYSLKSAENTGHFCRDSKILKMLVRVKPAFHLSATVEELHCRCSLMSKILCPATYVNQACGKSPSYMDFNVS